ncbi:leukocyte receptor cluster member 8 homolog isoform X2 [Onthophagus taurus]|uniref:leukocyte receptor cluster member 8 homolog isoform X2 n=1 Tax=Onthophagus taurus TaxID=166361 RepID=UPI0039BE8EFE
MLPNSSNIVALPRVEMELGTRKTIGWDLPPESLAYVPIQWLKYPEPESSIHYLLAIIYIMFFVMSITGNGLVLWIFTAAKNLRTPSNVFIVNLAFCDFIMMAKSPIFIYNAFNKGFACGIMGCKIFALLGSLSGIAAAMTNACIAYDRYTTISNPLEGKMTRVKALVMVFVVWAYTIPWAVLPFLEIWGRFVPEGYLTSCTFDYFTDTFDNDLFVAVIFTFSYAIPMTMIIYFYSQIVGHVMKHEKALKEQAKKMNVESLRSNANQASESAEVRIAKAAITICFLFVASWTPYAVMALIGSFGDASLLTPGVTMIPALTCKLVACIDPYVYAISHPRYRVELQARLPWLAIKEEESATSSTSTTTSSTTTTPIVQQQAVTNQWMYNYAAMYGQQFPYGMSPQTYAQYAQYYQYPQMMNYAHYAQTFKPVVAADNTDNNKKEGEKKDLIPPLPAGPPPPLLQKTPQFFNNASPIQKQFGNIRFSLNKKGPQNNGLNQANSLTSGAAKKKRKRNKNNQNNLNFNNFNMPPLPPPENDPKPAPPPELMPPLPSIPPLPDTKVPPPPLPTTETPKTKPLPNPLVNPTEEWPDSLKDYVKRCYEKCKTKIDRDQVDIVLKGKLTNASTTGDLWVRDWTKEPLPSIHSERINLEPKIVTGQLAQFQNNTTPKKGGGLSAAMGARLGSRASTLRGHSKSSSRSRSRSPALFYKKSRSKSRSPKRHRSSSSSTSSESFIPLIKPKQKGKITDRLGPANKNQKPLTLKQQKKLLKQKEKKSHFYSLNGFATSGLDEEQNSELLQQRAARFGKQQGQTSSSTIAPTPAKRRKQISGVTNFFIDTVNNKFEQDGAGDLDWTEFHIVGTCQDLEKSFLRLTKAPEPCEVRPVQVLRLSLQNVKSKWLEKQDYYYACDQLKSIRQDLTVQGVRNEFTVEVYETHARIALEKGDHEEFNQCQTQLKMLYSEVGVGEHKNEFTAYRILYYIFTKNSLDIMTILKSLSSKEKEDDSISFALKLRSAWAMGNFHRFFKLYLNAPLMAGYLVDWFIERERKLYLKYMIKSYRQNITVSFVAEEMAFKSQDECLSFLDPFGLTYVDDGKTSVDCKCSMLALPNI